MAGNTFGRLFRLTTFGESHGPAIGGVIDGCPAGLIIDYDAVTHELERRKPGQSKITTSRKETDEVRFLSGIFEGKTLGTPIGFIIENKDPRSSDYAELKKGFRPSHADFTYHKKYGHRDYRGGGRSSARETACRIVAGAIARQLMNTVKINAFVSSVGDVYIDKSYQGLDLSKVDDSIVRCPDKAIAEKMIEKIEETKKEGDTIGGTVTCVLQNVPIGLGEPVFDKFQAQLAKAMLSINAVKGFEYGGGFCSAQMKGSEHNDAILPGGKTATNLSGGIQGGISNGMDIYFRVAFKPVATIRIDQDSIDESGKAIKIKGKGRHDPCVVPRAVPIVEAMAAMVLADFYLLNKNSRL